MKLLILLSLVITFNTYASCNGSEKIIDLRKKHQEVLSSLPILDQGADGYCYAYTGKFLYDFHRYLKAKNTKAVTSEFGNISPAWSAAVGMNEGSDFNDDGGLACDVVRGLSAKPKNCISTSIEDHAFHELGPQIYRFLFDADALVNMYQGTASSMWGKFPVMTKEEFGSAGLKGDKLRMKNGFVNFQRKVRNALAGRSIEPTLAESPFRYYEMVKTSHYNKDYSKLSGTFALRIVEKSCRGWKPSVKVGCKEEPAYNLDGIDQQLDRGYPVGISYCSRVLKDRGYRGFPQTGKQSDCGMHASVVIGRKVSSQGTCQYLIRNSWGKKQKYDWKSEDGDIWVDMDALNDNIRDYQLVN